VWFHQLWGVAFVIYIAHVYLFIYLLIYRRQLNYLIAPKLVVNSEGTAKTCILLSSINSFIQRS
jgi:hypothetical protein